MMAPDLTGLFMAAVVAVELVVELVLVAALLSGVAVVVAVVKTLALVRFPEALHHLLEQEVRGQMLAAEQRVLHPVGAGVVLILELLLALALMVKSSSLSSQLNRGLT
jgi:hypothetical protein